MITPKMQFLAVIAVIIFFSVIIFLLKRNRVELRYTLLWFFSGFVMLILALFPKLLDWFANFVGIYSSVNALFAVVLFFGLMLMMSLTSIISREKQEIVRLIQEMSIIENRVRKLEKELSFASGDEQADKEDN